MACSTIQMSVFVKIFIWFSFQSPITLLRNIFHLSYLPTPLSEFIMCFHWSSEAKIISKTDLIFSILVPITIRFFIVWLFWKSKMWEIRFLIDSTTNSILLSEFVSLHDIDRPYHRNENAVWILRVTRALDKDGKLPTSF